MRNAKFFRETAETSIEISINLDGNGNFSGSSGVGFFDHMLSSFSKHSGIDISFLRCQGDVHIDYHHLVEDIGIVLGKCFCDALGDKRGIARFGFGSVPMDEALVQVSVDISGRGYLYVDPRILDGKIREFDLELVEVFFSGFVREARITTHIDFVRGLNKHHIVESTFKSFAIAIKDAIKIVSDDIPSTKRTL